MTFKMYRNAPGPYDLPFFLAKGYTIVDPPKDAA